MVSALSDYFDLEAIESLARSTGFSLRKSKLDAFSFLNVLMFTHQQGKDLSLIDICEDLYIHYGIHIKKQSVQDRFDEPFVQFMQAILERLLQHQLNAAGQGQNLSSFKRVRIKDSTRFALPARFAHLFQGHGGATHNSESMISIQYEYDLLSGKTMDLRLTTGTRNDQLDAKENTHQIAKGDLFIRDLGYATMGYLSQITENEAYFLNRLAPKATVYNAESPEERIDFTKCHKKIKKHNLPYLEYNVIIGKKAKIPCRLVICPVDDSTYEKRVRKTQKQAKSCGHQVTQDFKTRAKLTLLITNVEADKLPACDVKKTYGLRWQIELTFKIWKSQAKVNQVKEMKVQRFICQLIAKLIWLLIHWKIFKYLSNWVEVNHPGKMISIWKYYKLASSINSLTRTVITIPEELRKTLHDLAQLAYSLLLLEKRKGKTSHFEALMTLA